MIVCTRFGQNVLKISTNLNSGGGRREFRQRVVIRLIRLPTGFTITMYMYVGWFDLYIAAADQEI